MTALYGELWCRTGLGVGSGDDAVCDVGRALQGEAEQGRVVKGSVMNDHMMAHHTGACKVSLTEMHSPVWLSRLD